MKRPGYIKRKVPLKSGPSKQKAKRMKAVSPKRAERRKVARERYEDSRGVAFDDVESILGKDSEFWPKIGRPIRDPRVCSQFHALHDRCWMTGEAYPQAHHLGAGFTRGKRDEMCVLVSLSAAQHALVNTSELPLGTLLWLKWTHDWPHTDWIRLTLIYGRILDDLQPVELS